MTFRAADYFWDQNLIDLHDKVEPIKLSLTEYEAKLLLYKIEKDNWILGAIGVEDLGNGEARILHIAVEHQWRRRGIGSKLIKGVAALLGIVRFEAEISWDSAYFFRACGFKVWSLGNVDEESETETLKTTWEEIPVQKNEVL